MLIRIRTITKIIRRSFAILDILCIGSTTNVDVRRMYVSLILEYPGNDFLVF